jgi:hypothetical protein
MSDERKSWQEPMVWLMLGIPGATVIAGLATLAIAIQSGTMDTVPSAVQRVAKAQVLNSAVDEQTTIKNYHGILLVDRSTGAWKVSLKTDPADLGLSAVRVLFVHPNLAASDIGIELSAGEGVLQKALEFTPQQIIVTDDAGTWRLVGTYSNQSTIVLTPAVSAQ